MTGEYRLWTQNQGADKLSLTAKTTESERPGHKDSTGVTVARGEARKALFSHQRRKAVTN